MFKLTFCIAVCGGKYFPSLSFCFDYSGPSIYRSSTVWAVERNSSSIMYQFTRAVSKQQ